MSLFRNPFPCCEIYDIATRPDLPAMPTMALPRFSVSDLPTSPQQTPNPRDERQELLALLQKEGVDTMLWRRRPDEQ